MFFELIQKESDKCCYGVEDTIEALELSAVSTVLVWKYLDSFVAVDKQTGKKTLFNSDVEAFTNPKHYSRFKLLPFLEKTASKYGSRLVKLEGHSEEGIKFCKGFGVAGTEKSVS